MITLLSTLTIILTIFIKILTDLYLELNQFVPSFSCLVEKKTDVQTMVIFFISIKVNQFTRLSLLNVLKIEQICKVNVEFRNKR